MAYSDAGDAIDLTPRVGRATARSTGPRPRDAGRCYALFLGWHGKMVERAAPGGEGHVIDHFSRGAIRQYLARFDQAFAGHTHNRAPRLLQRLVRSGRCERTGGRDAARCSTSSSGAAATISAAICRRSSAATRDDRNARVLTDYRETISDLLLDTFTTEWGAWARRAEGRRPQPGARIAREPPRSLRRERHSGDRRRRDPALQVGDLRRARGGTPPRLGRGRHVARRALPLDARRRPRGGRSLLRRRRQPHRLSRHGLLAGQRTVAGTAVLRGGGVQPAERLVGRFRRAEPVRHARRSRSCRRASPITTCCSYYPLLRFAGRARQRAADALRRRERAARPAPPSKRPARRCSAAASRTTTSPIGSCRATRVDGAGSSPPAAVRTRCWSFRPSRFIPLETFEHVLALARDGASVVVARAAGRRTSSGLANLPTRRERLRERPRRFDSARRMRTASARRALGRGPDSSRRRPRAAPRPAPASRGSDWSTSRCCSRGAPTARRTRVFHLATRTRPDGRRLDPARRPDRDRLTVFDPMHGRRGSARVRPLARRHVRRATSSFPPVNRSWWRPDCAPAPEPYRRLSRRRDPAAEFQARGRFASSRAGPRCRRRGRSSGSRRGRRSAATT